MIVPKLGIDQSKVSFDACLVCGGKQRRRKFSNDEAGFRALSEWLISLSVDMVHMSMESTGRYGNKLAQFMFAAGHKVSIVNPKCVVNHRKAMGIRNKTDSNDAFVNADYARVHEPGPWHPAEPAMLELRDLVGQIELFKKHRTAYINRSKCGLESSHVEEINRRLVKQLTEEIRALEARALAIIEPNQRLNQRYRILLSVPGIGPVIALSLVAQIDFDQFPNGRNLAAFLGLSPALSQSGTTENRSRTSKAGDSGLRTMVRQGATSAKRGVFYRPFVNRLTLKGKRKTTVTNAVARKMLLIAHACIRRGQLFSSSYVHPLARAA